MQVFGNFFFYPFVLAMVALLFYFTDSAGVSGADSSRGIVPATTAKLEAFSMEDNPDIHPAGLPILALLNITNTGTTSFHYWCGGPDKYPGANHFSATVTDEQGKSRDIEVTNGQFTEGSGTFLEVRPGKLEDLPAVLPPLPPGKYSLQFRSLKQIRQQGTGQNRVTVADWPEALAVNTLKVNVKTNEKAAAVWKQNLLERVSEDEPFALHVAVKYNIDTIINTLVANLDSDNAKTSSKAARALLLVKPLPLNTATVIRRAVRKYLARTNSPGIIFFSIL